MSTADTLAHVFMDAAAELARIDGDGMWHVGEQLRAAVTVTAAAEWHLPYETWRDLTYRGAFDVPPTTAFPTLVGLARERQLS